TGAWGFRNRDVHAVAVANCGTRLCRGRASSPRWNGWLGASCRARPETNSRVSAFGGPGAGVGRQPKAPPHIWSQGHLVQTIASSRYLSPSLNSTPVTASADRAAESSQLSNVAPLVLKS